MVIFAWLVVLTGLEVVVAQLEIAKNLIVSSLILMAIAKAVLVAGYYMHLKQETAALRKIVSLCLAFPVLYAVVLIAEVSWRLLP